MTFPAANRSVQWFYDTVGGSNMGAVEKVVWHTTEGTGWPWYDSGRKAPHYTVLPNYSMKRMEWRAHFPDTVNARAMRNETGGVQTNLDGALQVEIVGTCDQTPRAANWTKGARVLKSWALEDWQIAGLAQFVAWAHREHGVPLAAPALWLAYGADPRAPGRVPASYGASPARMTGRVWDAFRGHCGHQHAPENDHGDPGRLNIGEVFARAADLVAPARNLLEDIMALDRNSADYKALVADIAAAVANTPQPLMGYVDALYSDADHRMTLAQAAQHAAGQAYAANGTAGKALDAAVQARQAADAAVAAVAALQAP